MRPTRLQRLSLLTQGLALVGFGVTEGACAKEHTAVNGPPDDLHINAPPTPEDAAAPAVVAQSAPDSAAPTAVAPADASTTITLPFDAGRPTMNAPPKFPPHGNAMPKAPDHTNGPPQ